MYNFELGLSPLWLLPCLLVAGGFSAFLYYRFQSVWGQKWNLPLSILRFFGVFILLFLLLSPLLRTIENQTQQAKIQILVDNSESLMLVDSKVKDKIKSAVEQLIGNENEVKFELFDLEKKQKTPDSIAYNFGTSDISQAIKNLSDIGAGEHHVATVLITDGIVNQGIGLKDFISSKPIFVLGTGDTIQVNDLYVNDLYVNKSSYKGNEFPVQTSVQGLGFKGKSTKVVFKVDGETIDTRVVNFSTNNELIDLSFAYTSKKAGYLKVECVITPLAGEKIKTNNQKARYVLVKDGRKKIALVAASPHPDLKAIKTSLEKLDKYELELVILSFGAKLPDFKTFDAFILHQIPCKGCQSNVLNQIVETKKPRWYISGLQSDFATLNKVNNTLIIKGLRGVDEVGGAINPSFDLFTTDDLDFGFVAHAAPLKVPFADIENKAGTQVLFEQTVGNISNKKTLFGYNNRSDKELVMLGEGLWQWKMFEFLENGSTINFDLLVSKSIGLIDGNEQDTQFEVITQKDSYLESEKPSFAISVKNQLGELVYDQPIDLIVKQKDKIVSKSNFKVSASDPFYKLSSLTEGVYTYYASTKVGDKVLKDAGSFSVSDLKLENKDLRADHASLRVLAQNSKGDFQLLSDFDQKKWLKTFENYPNKIISHEQERYFNELPWILFLILLLFSIEWIARKFLGDV